jgi:protein-S-isoprenylcysteine O-methyltransferase Ste14
MHHHFLALYARGPAWQALFWSVYAAWLGSEAWILSRDRRPATGDPADRGSRRLLVAMYAIGLVGGFGFANRLEGWRIGGDPRLVFGIGLALMFAGMAFRLWAVLTLGRFFRTAVQVLDDHRLVGEGPYARLRHPSYTGALVTLAGIGVALGNWLGLAWILGFGLIGFGRRIEVEDAALKARFGPAYDDYARGRRALVPFVW